MRLSLESGRIKRIENYKKAIYMVNVDHDCI